MPKSFKVKPVKIGMKEVLNPRTCTIEVQLTGVKQFKIRLIVAKFLIICAAKILNTGIKFNKGKK